MRPSSAHRRTSHVIATDLFITTPQESILQLGEYSFEGNSKTIVLDTYKNNSGPNIVYRRSYQRAQLYVRLVQGGQISVAKGNGQHAVGLGEGYGTNFI